MSIDTSNFVSSASNALSLESGVSSPAPGLELPSGFMEAFVEQMQLLETNGRSGALKSLQVNADLLPADEMQNLEQSLCEAGNRQTIADILGQGLPLSLPADKNSDLPVGLSVLADGLPVSDQINAAQLVKEIHQAVRQFSQTATDQQQINNDQELAALLSIVAGKIASGEATTGADGAEDKLPDHLYSASVDADSFGAALEPNDAVLGINLAAPAVLSDKAGKLGVSAEEKLGSVVSNLQQAKKAASFSASASTKEAASNNSETAFLKQSLAGHSGESAKSTPLNAVNTLLPNDADLTDKNIGFSQEFGSVEEKTLVRGLAELNQLNKPTTALRQEAPALAKPISHPEWDKDLGESIIWMNNRSIPAAEIKINPPHLGPISVRVDINQDQASISFAAQHSAVREALEASVPKLRELMQAQQLNLAEVNVSQQFSSDQQKSQAQQFSESSAQPETIPVPEAAGQSSEAIETEQAIVTKGLLSIYA
jgi:flagellar hook-length control protein FliK